MTPKHYQTPVSPWNLQMHMHSSDDAFVDARQCDAIKYIFHNKQSLLDDLKKAKHYLKTAIAKLEPATKDMKYFAALRATPPSIFFRDKTLDNTQDISPGPTDSVGISSPVDETIHTPFTQA